MLSYLYLFPNRRQFDIVVTDHTSCIRPNDTKFLCRTKTTAASINAKTKLAVKAKILAATSSIAKKRTDVASIAKKTTSIASTNPSLKSTPPPKATVSAIDTSKISKSQPRSKILNEVGKQAGNSGKISNRENGKPSKRSLESNSSKTHKPKPQASADSQIKSKVIKPSSESYKKNHNSINSANEKRLPSSPQAGLKVQSPIAHTNFETSFQELEKFRATRNVTKSKPLPPNYKYTKRKVTMAIVALPIVIVTSWVLFERLWLGKERKELVPPGMSQVQESRENKA
ncbi:hypothetical protein HI914_04636 [Erysiphe necator]|nr:hypothetical protein HI914_04636 [Erysiphe necator]